MKIKYNILGLFVILITLWGCEDFYSPKIEDLSGALVIEAMLTDQPDYLTIKLSRTSVFDSRSYFNSERNAKIYMLSSEGEMYYFYETSGGYYRSFDSIYTSPGVSYHIYITTSDGEGFMSREQTMPEPCNIDQIELQDSVYREVSYNYWGEPYVKDFEGIFFSVKPTEPTNSNVGFLYEWNALVNYRIESSDGPFKHNYYCWKKIKSNLIYVYDYNQGLSENTLILDDVNFLSYYNLSPLPLDSSRFEGTVKSAYSRSFYYKLKQYTISNKSADFWQAVKRQTEANGKLFDPVEEEIPTNIFCDTNPDLKAFGFFTIASYTEQTIAVMLGTRYFEKIGIIDFFPNPKVDEDCLEERTEFWIN